MTLKNVTKNDDNHHNDIQHDSTQDNDTQHNDIQHNSTQDNDTQQNDSQHYDSQDNDTLDTNTQDNDPRCRGAREKSENIVWAEFFNLKLARFANKHGSEQH
jgi:hypothetical protein